MLTRASQIVPGVRAVGAAMLVLVALLQYVRSLGLGLLSDDFALYDWAMRHEWLPPSWPYVRPAILAVWSVLLHDQTLTSGATVLHLASVVTHGINGALVARVGELLGLKREPAWLAGLLFVIYPTSVEAVVWPSAFSDVLVASSTMTAVIAASRVQSRTQSAVVIGALTVTALLAKESATGLPLLFGVAALAVPDPRARRRLLDASIVAAVLVVGYLGARAIAGRWPGHPGVTSAAAFAVLSEPFLTLAWPFHAGIRTLGGLDRILWLAVALTLGFAALPRLHESRVVRTLGLGALWIVGSAAPTAGLFAITTTLEGTRYIYVATIAWVLLLASGVTWNPRGHPNRLVVTTAACLVTLAAALTWRQQQPWTDAAAARDAILPVLAELPPQCERAFVVGLPDTVNGAHVARNGMPQALALVHGRSLEFAHGPAETSPECRLDFAAFRR